MKTYQSINSGQITAFLKISEYGIPYDRSSLPPLELDFTTSGQSPRPCGGDRCRTSTSVWMDGRRHHSTDSSHAMVTESLLMAFIWMKIKGKLNLIIHTIGRKDKILTQNNKTVWQSKHLLTDNWINNNNKHQKNGENCKGEAYKQVLTHVTTGVHRCHLIINSTPQAQHR